MQFSTPSLSEFIPLKKQYEIISDIRTEYDYGLGTHEVLMSGAVGSAKSILLAHLAVTHCIFNPQAVVGIGRLTLPSLKETLLDVILKHLYNEIEFEYNQVKSIIKFPNQSKIMSFSWADKNYKKFRSHELSAFFIEELTENKQPEFYDEMSMRVGRLKHVNEKLIVSATNPDSPDHWAYKRFITKDSANTHVYYSVTHENPYLPQSYISQLQENLDPKMARRMLYGEWLEISQEVIYYCYSKEHNYRDVTYKVDTNYPIHWSWDFNIGLNKPMSSVFFQYIKGEFHFFNEIIINSTRTDEILSEAANKGLLDEDTMYIINGDATGRHRDTRSKHSDYDIIKTFLDNYKNKSGTYIKYSIDVPLSNPKIRDRHNIINALLQNSKGERRIFVYKDCKTTDEGMRLTKLKEGAQYLEDDSKSYQHVTTALGYGCISAIDKEKRDAQSIARYRR